MTEASTTARRPVRSFVLRQGRATNAQRRALDALMPAFGIAFAEAPLDFETVFGRRAPVFLEIGFGMGEALAGVAGKHPENDYLGVEVHSPGVGALLKRVGESGLTNVRIVRHDAVEVLTNMIPDGSLAGVHIFFPDPWPKSRHHKRRLIRPPFVALVAKKLAPRTYVHAATDWQDYARQMLDVFSAEPALENAAPGFAPRPAHRPLTKFESRGLRLGHRVWDLIFRRRDAVASAS